MFSPATLDLFGQLLNDLKIPAGHPQIVEFAVIVQNARAELQAAIDAVDAPADATANGRRVDA
jgi:hypothetical protein